MDPLASLRRVPDLVRPDDAALDRARARLMARATADPGATDDLPARVRRPARRTVLLGAAACVAGLVAASVLAAPRSAVASGLTVAADQVTDPALSPGQFLRVTTLHDLRDAHDVLQRVVQVVWIPWDRGRTWVQRTTAPDGSTTVDRERYGQVSATIDWEAVEFVARTPAGFRSLLPDWVDPSDPTWASDGVQWAQQMLSSGEVPATIRAEIYRWLASLAGVHQGGRATLPTGRAGTVFGASNAFELVRREIVVDLATGEYLGDRTWDTSPGTPSGERLVDQRALTGDVVDSAP